ncbi:MAG: hypothetical protein KAR12_15870 [Methylococcales bacterium]|nr:hypothetical protein [Methylococcales bacterium]
MANTNAPYGFRAVRHLTGGCVSTNEYTILSAYAANIWSGDPVNIVADGTIQVAADGVADACGIFSGCSYVNAAGDQVFSKYWPTGTVATEIKALVFDNPEIIFAVQSDATGIAAADVGATANWEIVAGDTTIGISKSNLDASGGLNATEIGLRVLRIIDIDDNEAGAYSDVEVLLNEHAYRLSATGV